jgi:hypothetical protein
MNVTPQSSVRAAVSRAAMADVVVLANAKVSLVGLKVVVSPCTTPASNATTSARMISRVGANAVATGTATVVINVAVDTWFVAVSATDGANAVVTATSTGVFNVAVDTWFVGVGANAVVTGTATGVFNVAVDTWFVATGGANAVVTGLPTGVFIGVGGT